jgi:membrane protein implicated in regulation of membrane protease activity
MMDAFQLPVGYLWLIAGALLMALEAFGAPGIGLLFGGIAGVLVGILLQADVLALTDYTLQFGLWFAFTAVTALLLWKPMQRWRSKPTEVHPEFRNMIGDHATIVEGELVRGSTGQARWSGTIMLAEIDPVADATRIAEGELVEITNVRGNTLYVRPRGSRRMEEII